jgi:hypothetical protein
VKRKRSWVSLIGFCMLTALGAALALAIIFAGASVALASHQSAGSEQTQNPSSLTPMQPAGHTFSGMITDSRCGARHLRNSHQSPAECTRTCVRLGASYVLVDGDRRYTLVGGEDSLRRLAGERANVTGTRQGEAIVVSSAAPVF